MIVTMEHLPTYSLDPAFFKDVQIGTEFVGKLKGFRPTKDYWIGVCELKNITKQSETGELYYATVDFIICKKSENTLSGIMGLKQLSKEKRLKLTLKGMTSKGFPIFFHEFI